MSISQDRLCHPFIESTFSFIYALNCSSPSTFMSSYSPITKRPMPKNDATSISNIQCTPSEASVIEGSDSGYPPP